jgi:hypothetical protein
MLRIVWWLMAGLLTLGTLSGCVQPRYRDTRDDAERGPVAASDLPTVSTPPKISLESLSLVSYQSVEQTLSSPPPVQEYRLLSASQCQCLAAAHSMLGNLQARESQIAAASSASGRDRKAAGRALAADLSALRAVEERNRSAARALELYYRLTEGYFSRDLLDDSLEATRRSIQEYEQAKAKGLSVAVDADALRRQEIELSDRRLQLQTSTRQLDGQLCRLLGLEPDEKRPLWPSADLRVTVAPVDANVAVSQGLAARPDVALWCVLAENTSEDALPAVRGAIQGLDPLARAAAPGNRILLAAAFRTQVRQETHIRRAQVLELLADQRRSAEDDIRRAVGDVELRLGQVGLAKDKLDRWRHRIQQLRETRAATGTVTSFEIAAAEVEVFRAESDAFHAAVEWKTAEVKLREAQGLLAAQCGYELPVSCREPCSGRGGARSADY